MEIERCRRKNFTGGMRKTGGDRHVHYLNHGDGFTELYICQYTHSSTLAWKIPWTVEPGRLQSMGSLRVGQD